MRRVVCWVKGHDYERVKPLYPTVVPGSGVFIKYEADPGGSAKACRRCRRVAALAAVEARLEEEKP